MYEAWFIVLPSAYNAPHFLEISMVRDILLGLMKRLVKTRASNLKVLITSATLDGSKVSRFFSNCPILTVPGKLFPVEILYSAELPKSYIESSLKTAIGTFWTWVYSMQNFCDLWNAYRHAFHYYVYKFKYYTMYHIGGWYLNFQTPPQKLLDNNGCGGVLIWICIFIISSIVKLIYKHI